MNDNILFTIAPIAHQLTKLCLRQNRESLNSFYDVLSVIGLCKNLKLLHLREFRGSVNLTLPFAPQSSKLKKLVLEGNYLPARGFLPLLFQCVHIEAVILKGAIFSKQDINAIVRSLATGDMLQNLTKLVLEPKGYYNNDYNKEAIASQYRPGKPKARELVPAMEKLVKYIICSCPKLLTVRLGLEHLYGAESYASTISPFLESFTKI